MLTKNVRRLGLIALTLGVFFLVRAWFDHRSRDDNVPTSSTARVASPSLGRVNAAAPASDVSDAVASRAVFQGAASAPEESARSNEAHMRLEVRAPPDVRVRDVFEVPIAINANAAVRELMFLVRYEQFRLRLVGWSRGNFTQQRDRPAEFGAEEPSDGNIQITYKASSGFSAAGAGDVIVLEFEAIAPGISAIALQNVTASDVAGTMDPKGFALHDAQVTVR